MGARDGDRLDDLLPARAFELGELGLELRALGRRQLLPVLVAQWPQPQEPPQHPPPPPEGLKLGALAAPCTANVENWRETFAAEQSGQATCWSPRTSSSKCDSHSMQTYS